MTDFNRITGNKTNPLKINQDGRNKQAAPENSPQSAAAETPSAARPTLSADAVLNHLAQQAQGVKIAASQQVEQRRIEGSVAAFTEAWSPEDHQALVDSISGILTEAGYKPGSETHSFLVEDSVNRYFDKIWGEPAIAG